MKSLKDRPELKIEIAGHTDSVGRAAYNESLSRRGAEAVRTYLVSKGVEGARMTARGYGETDPIADNSTEEGRSSNHRVELKRID